MYTCMHTQHTQEHYKPEMTLAEAEVLALSTLKQVMEEKVSLALKHIAQ